jgi:diadenosine tetraphosphate (Ap4A) HIT family hydrolase
MDEWKKDRLQSALDGTNPTVVARMKSGFAVLGDTQFLPGYCILIASPSVKSLNDLELRQRSEFLLDMSLIGDALRCVCRPIKINYEILINAADFLHAHVFPRYDWEPEERRKKPVWLYDNENRFSPENLFSANRHSGLQQQLADQLNELMNQNY